MPVNLPPELQQANAYLRAGQKQAARSILIDFVRRHPNDELAWLMLSRTMDEPQQRADCLRQALRINPSNEDARRQIETLKAAPPAAPAPKPAPPQAAAASRQPTPPPATPREQKPASERPDWAPPAWEPPQWNAPEQEPPAAPSTEQSGIDWTHPGWEPPEWDFGSQETAGQSQPGVAQPLEQTELDWEHPEWEPPEWDFGSQGAASQPQAAAQPPAQTRIDGNQPEWATPEWDLSSQEPASQPQAQPTAAFSPSRPEPAWTPPPAPIDLYSTQAHPPAQTPEHAPDFSLDSDLEAVPEARPKPGLALKGTPADRPTPQVPSETDLLESKPTKDKGASRLGKAGLSKGKIIGLVVFGLVVAGLSCVALFVALSSLWSGTSAGPTIQPQAAAQLTLASQGQPALPASPTAASGAAGFVLPPTWTPTPQPTASATPTITPTPAPSPTPTYLAPPPTVSALMGRIEQEMADLRGLPIQQHPPRYLVSTTLVENMLKTELEASGGIAELQDEARYLAALGLIKPTYDVVRYTLNGLVDGIGGFYRPDSKEIYVLGLQFRGMEHLTYAHEFDHALVDQQFNLEYLTEQALCETNTDRCIANRALVEGDATLAMMQWLKQYASPQDYRDLYNYRMPAQAIPEQYPPDYVVHSLQFPYDQGLVFVNKLYEQGNWARVNLAYANPPISSEQILHPEKYLAGEAPLAMQDPSLEVALGKAWRPIKNEVLGEFQTYMLLAYGADKAAQRAEDAAARAAAGWGGDQVQVFYNDETAQTALAAHWVWDTPEDAAEFELSMREYLDMLMRGARLERPYGYCWEANQQVNCLYIKGSDTLWLSTPDQASMETSIMLFSNIATP